MDRDQMIEIAMEALADFRFGAPESIVEVVIDALQKAGALAPAGLDTAWEQINALGGRSIGKFDDGINHCVDQALVIIESLGGKDPLVRRGDRQTERASEEAA